MVLTGSNDSEKAIIEMAKKKKSVEHKKKALVKKILEVPVVKEQAPSERSLKKNQGEKKRILVSYLSKGLQRLHDYQRDIILDVVSRAFDREVIVRSDYPMLGLNWRDFPIQTVAQFLGVNQSTVNSWTRDGKHLLKRNENGRLNMEVVVQWLIDREGLKHKSKEVGMDSLRRQQMQAIIKQKEFDLNKAKGLVVDTEYHEAVLAARISDLRGWMETNFPREFFKMANKNLEELQKLAPGMMRSMMDAYIGGSKGVEKK